MTNDPDAEFTALVQRQSRFVFRVAYAVLRNSFDAEDAVQETFLKLFRNGGWKNLGSERAFLARVAWRIAVDKVSRSVKSSRPIAAENAAIEDDAPSLGLGPEQTLMATNQQEMVHAMIDTLPQDLRVPLVLSAFDELNSREIGSILGIPEGTVRTRLQRARHVLRQKLMHLDKLQEIRNA